MKLGVLIILIAFAIAIMFKPSFKNKPIELYSTSEQLNKIHQKTLSYFKIDSKDFFSRDFLISNTNKIINNQFSKLNTSGYR